jgi:hypothetical protein
MVADNAMSRAATWQLYTDEEATSLAREPPKLSQVIAIASIRPFLPSVSTEAKSRTTIATVSSDELACVHHRAISKSARPKPPPQPPLHAASLS